MIAINLLPVKYRKKVLWSRLAFLVYKSLIFIFVVVLFITIIVFITNVFKQKEYSAFLISMINDDNLSSIQKQTIAQFKIIKDNKLLITNINNMGVDLQKHITKFVKISDTVIRIVNIVPSGVTLQQVDISFITNKITISGVATTYMVLNESIKSFNNSGIFNKSISVDRFFDVGRADVNIAFTFSTDKDGITLKRE